MTMSSKLKFCNKALDYNLIIKPSNVIRWSPQVAAYNRELAALRADFVRRREAGTATRPHSSSSSNIRKQTQEEK